MVENLIEKILKEHILEKNAVFVFPTEISANLWADRATLITECSAVAMEKFMAWDKFKGEAVRGENQDKNPVPGTMRSIFAAGLIEENAASSFLKNLIVPEYAKTAAGFANWIASILPGLGLWKEYFDKNGGEKDEEDEDLLCLYNEYCAFLNKYNLFDPAWERPPFKDTGKHYYIFFPEIHSDWEEYRAILEASDKFITIINLPEKNEIEGEVKLFNNSRVEIKNVASVLSQLHREKGLEWSDIALSVPDMDIFGPYIDRELQLMEIPHVTKYAKPLSATGAGSFFEQIKKCIETENSYDSVKDLLFNRELPWKEQALGEELVAFGQENHCICSFTYNNKKIDVWKESLRENCTNQLVDAFYNKLKKSLEKFKGARSFAEVREVYFEFRRDFFDMSLCSEKTNNVLSRCISELSGIIDFEQEFTECKVPSPFNFYVDFLSGVKYLEQQTSEGGVQILPYKTAATAPFGCQLVVDSSQSGLNIIYRELGFLNEEKRVKLLNRDETNVSEKFIRLYQMNSLSQPAYFTCAKRTLDGYAQATSYLKENDCSNETDEEKLFPGNPYNVEKAWLLEKGEFPEKITATEKTSAENWLKMQRGAEAVQDKAIDVVATLKTEKDENGNEKPVYFSQTGMKLFFNCPRKWFYQYGLQIEEENNAAQLLDTYAVGNLYHKIMELFCKKLIDKKMTIKIDEEGGITEDLNKALDESINDAISTDDWNYDNFFLKKELFDTTREAITKTMKKAVTSFCTVFNNTEVVESEGKVEYRDPENKYKMSGRLDLLLRDKENLQYYLVDFKSGYVPAKFYADEPEEQVDEEGNKTMTDPDSVKINEQNLPDFQMPMYIWMLEHREKPIKVENAAFFNVTKAECKTVFGKELAGRNGEDREAAKNYDDFQKTIKKMHECIDYYTSCIRNGDYRIDDKIQNYTKCFGCDFNPICRKTFNVGKKE